MKLLHETLYRSCTSRRKIPWEADPDMTLVVDLETITGMDLLSLLGLDPETILGSNLDPMADSVLEATDL
jgi:hypothetical protein